MTPTAPRLVDYPDAATTTAYLSTRTDPGTRLHEIGAGHNHYPSPPELPRHLANLLRDLGTGATLSSYTDPYDGAAQHAFALLAAHHLDTDITAADVLFTRGGTEAISLTVSYLAGTGRSLLLPIPAYYGFDQSASRWAAPVAAYYRHDGRTHPREPTAPRPALIDVVPNGVTGRHFTVPDLPVDFTVVDAVFNAGALHGTDLRAQLRRRVRDLDLTRAAIILTASKDLSLPGIRGAALITRDPILRRHIARDRGERAPTVCPLGAHLMVTYLALLHIAHAPHFADGYAAVRNLVAGTGLPALPDAADMHRLTRHLADLSRHLHVNLDTVLACDDLLDFDTAPPPAAGYSAFPRLRLPTHRGPFLAWVRERATEDGLKLNPAHTHGGTPSAWQALYPDSHHLRLNLSVTHERLRDDIGLLTRLAG